MTYASILSVVDGGPCSERCLQAGLAVSRQFQAHLTCLFTESDPQSAIPVLGEGMAGVVVEQMIESLQSNTAERLRVAQELFDRYCVADATVRVLTDDEMPASGELSARFRRVVGQEPDQVTTEGHLVDLLVLPFPDEEGDGASVTTLDAALLDSSRPVLLVPKSGYEGPCKVVTVGWDGSRESANAVVSALPLMETAEKVIVLSGHSEDQPAQPQALLHYLSARGIGADCQEFTPSDAGLGEDLVQQTLNHHGGLLVMGAYGHSRLREMLLGGATHDVLKTARLPVLMAH